MNMCFNCGYMYADVDDNGNPVGNEYCHCNSDWPPCEEDEYVEPYDAPYDYGDDYYIGYDADEMCQEIYMERTIQIWLDGQVIEEFDFDFDDDMDEDSITQAVIEYVYGNIDIQVLQESKVSERIKEVIEAYERFQHFRNNFSGLYIYSYYEKDLETLLKFVESEIAGLEVMNEED